MDSPELLAGLRDIHVPPAPLVEMSDVAAGALAFAIVAAAALAAFLWRRRSALRREALAQLAATGALAPEERLVAQAKLLRRVARSRSDDAVTTRGDDWLRQLDRLFRTRFFSDGHGRIFGEALYARATQVDAEALEGELRRLIGRLP